MFCEKCGMKVENNWVNCPRCGARIGGTDILQENIKQDTIEKNEQTQSTYSFMDWVKFRLILAGIGVILMMICVLLVGIFG